MGLTARPDTPAEFYERWTELFRRGFGPVFQAGILLTGNPPTEDPEKSVLALAERAGISGGDVILDAGCGVGGPASIIARHFPDVTIDGVTNSPAQVKLARQELSALGLSDRVRIHLADYQELPFSSDVFHKVIFFESTGYASDLDLLYSEAARVLLPGGSLYVKDVFRQPGVRGREAFEQMKAFDELWGCVRTKSVVESIRAIEATGLHVAHAGEMASVGTARLAGSMFSFDPADGLRPTEFGQMFARKNLDPPIEFAEILAVKGENEPAR